MGTGFDLSDIMSILDEGTQKKPEKAAPAIMIKPNEPEEKAQEAPAATSAKDNVFIAKLLSDIEQKNAEILKLNTEIMSLKYELKDREMEIKIQASELENVRKSLEDANKNLEDVTKKLDEANVKLGEMDADRAKLKAKAAQKDEPQAPEPEEDVASIFKRLTKPPEDIVGDKSDGNVNPDKQPPAPRKTAKLYDL